jgi:hypothetical protein
VDQVVAVAQEARIVLDLEDHDDVAARAAARADVALPAQRQVVVGGDARRDLDVDGVLRALQPLAAAARARVGDAAPLAATGRAGRWR